MEMAHLESALMSVCEAMIMADIPINEVKLVGKTRSANLKLHDAMKALARQHMLPIISGNPNEIAVMYNGMFQVCENLITQYHNDLRKSLSAELMNHLAANIVDEIVRDLSGRRGLREAWGDVDGDIQRGIKKNWCNMIVYGMRRRDG